MGVLVKADRIKMRTDMRNIGMTQEEIDNVLRDRVAEVVNNRSGFKVNVDAMNHPFAEYFICRRQLLSTDGILEECGEVSISAKEAEDHAREHFK